MIKMSFIIPVMLLFGAQVIAEDVSVFSRGIMTDVDPEVKPEPGEALAEINLHALQGEFEPFTFTVYNPGDKPLDLQVALTPFAYKGPMKEYDPPIDQFTIHVLQRAKIRRWGKEDWVLSDLKKIIVPAGQNLRFWGTVRVRKVIYAGGIPWQAVLKLTWGEGKKEIPVNLHVARTETWQPPGKLFYLLSTVSPNGQYIRKHSPEKLKELRPAVVAFYRELAEHGMTGAAMKTNDFPYQEGSIEGLKAETSAALEAGLKGPILWNMMALIDAAKGGDKYDFNGRMDNWDEKEDLRRLHKLHKLASAAARENKWPEIIYYPIDEPGTQFEERKWLLRSMEILQLTGREIQKLGARSHSTITECVDEKHNKAPRWSKTPDEMRKLWDQARPHLAIRNYGYGYPQGKTNLFNEIKDAEKYGFEVWMYNNAAIMGTNRYCARMYWGLWSWKMGITGTTAWTYPGGRTVQFEIAREGIDDHKALCRLEFLVAQKKGPQEARKKAEAFLTSLKKAVKVDANGFVGDWADVAHQGTEAQKLATGWDAVDYKTFKADLVRHLDALYSEEE